MENEPSNLDSLSVSEKLHSETATIAWKELQRFFAQGVVMWLDGDCDLIEVGEHVAQDNSPEIKALLEKKKFAAVTPEQAKKWYANDAMLWSLVVAPFVLVQERE